MWTVVKIKKNYCVKNLKSNLKSLLVVSPEIYSPKILQQEVRRNKFYNKTN